jgi:hypothetical protein
LKWNVLIDGRSIGTVAETQARTGQKMYDATSTSGKVFRGRTRKDAVEQLEKAKATDADGSSTKHADMMLYHALPVRIETPKGGVRSGPGWQTTMPAAYGFIEGTTGADGDSIDCYVGPDPESSNVYVVDQYKLDGKSFDEHKVMLGYLTQEAAVADYMAGHHLSDRVFAAMTRFTMPQFRKWLSHHDMTQPCDPSVEVRPWA